MPIELEAGAPRAAKPFILTGRHVLATIVGFFIVVGIANGAMMYSAIRTMPGLDAGRNGYDVSQRYNAEIGAAEAQTRRGWTSDAEIWRVAGGSRAVARFRDAGGAPVDGLTVELAFNHPADRRLDHVVKLSAQGNGGYGANFETLSSPIWDVVIYAVRDGEVVYQSRARRRI